MRPPARQPRRDRLRILRIAHRAEQKRGKRVPGVRTERKIRAAKSVVPDGSAATSELYRVRIVS